MEHKILIIDDDVELCKLLSYRLAEEKIAVNCAIMERRDCKL